MSEHRAAVDWRRTSADFQHDTFARSHAVRFGSGQVVEASSAPEFKGDPGRVDPEELLAAAVSSCHMLTFLALAARSRVVVDEYSDEAAALLEKDERGRAAISRVVLRPRVRFAPESAVTPERLRELHERAHKACFVAAAVRCEVVIEPRA